MQSLKVYTVEVAEHRSDLETNAITIIKLVYFDVFWYSDRICSFSFWLTSRLPKISNRCTGGFWESSIIEKSSAFCQFADGRA